MGKAQKLLNILVTDKALYDTPEVQKLVAQGHTIMLANYPTIEGVEWDAYLGADCWHLSASQVKYLPVAVRAMREHRYGGKK